MRLTTLLGTLAVVSGLAVPAFATSTREATQEEIKLCVDTCLSLFGTPGPELKRCVANCMEKRLPPVRNVHATAAKKSKRQSPFTSDTYPGTTTAPDGENGAGVCEATDSNCGPGTSNFDGPDSVYDGPGFSDDLSGPDSLDTGTSF